MPTTLVTSAGAQVDIGRRLGKGGEGDVYEVSSHRDLAAKLYNTSHLPDTAKQAKLRFMAKSADRELLKFTAWPQDTLHKNCGGPVVGFLMPKVTHRAPIHILYSPAHRRQDYPQAAWDFLLYAARNTAAAFGAVHDHGHVLGDVNQGNVLVGADSKVVLIDTDSFQVNASGTVHLCEVGVAHFTPPELQGVSSFGRVPRSNNHDNFGLALLIFHLLFGGRHPYSGVPLRQDVGESLEEDIRSCRYAYAKDGPQRGSTPPPKSIPISIVPDSVQAMFSAAFTESGKQGGRPTAQQWVAALDGLRNQLARCQATAMHVYPRHISRCPWCALEGHGVLYFVDLHVGPVAAAANGFILKEVWTAIESELPPPDVIIPQIAAKSYTPAPLPNGLDQTTTKIVLRLVIAVATICLFSAAPKAWLFTLLGAWFAWAMVGNVGRGAREEERKRRQTAKNIARVAYEQLVDEMRHRTNPEALKKKKHELALLKQEYEHLPERQRSEIAQLHTTAVARQKNKFLERHFIDSASITGVGPAKKAALRSFGIETAADVTRKRVMGVKGFGTVLTQNMLDWRDACERRFVFNPIHAVTEADKDAIRASIAARRRNIESALNSGVVELRRVRLEITHKSKVLTQALQQASERLGQAEADLKLV